MAGTDRQTDSEILERTRQETKKPELYKVVLLNDDYTTMDFVIEVLETIFHKQPAEAFRIMMMVHTQGKGLCGVYPFEVAETKVESVVESAANQRVPAESGDGAGVDRGERGASATASTVLNKECSAKR